MIKNGMEKNMMNMDIYYLKSKMEMEKEKNMILMVI